jgi:K+/H+ antiporter YhaU regulatory subunit KhtT
MANAAQVLKDMKRQLDQYLNQQKYYKSLETRVKTDADKAKVAKLLADVTDKITAAQEKADEAEGMLAAAVEEKAQAEARKQQMAAIDKAKKEGMALYDKKAAINQQMEMLKSLTSKFQNDAAKLAANADAIGKLQTEMDKLQQ